MPLVVHRSAHPEVLAAKLAAILAIPPADPMATDTLAVHSGGLEQWLAMQVAQQNGICSAVEFVRPDELVARLAAEALGEAADFRAWAQPRLLWALLATLPALLDLPQLAPVRAYLDAEGPTEHTLRLVTLCQRLAGVFQAYGTYRPDLVHAWQSATEGEDWEAPVWRAVEARLGATHLTAWADRLATASRVPAPRGRVLLFSVTTLPPLTLKVVARLAGDRELHLFALHPSPAAWVKLEEAANEWRDIPERDLLGALDRPGLRPAHPLLASMGTLARDFELAALRCQNVVHDLLPCEPPERATLLTALQADLHDDMIRPFVMKDMDNSVQVHVCTSPLRQVQALRDVLLDLLDDPTLQPRDIVVMSPDVEMYAPLVEAVFGDGSPRWTDASAHPAGFPALPFRMADRGVRSENQAAEALLRLLDLVDSRFEAPAVMEMLALDPVRERFGLDAASLPRAHELLVEAGVRWGRDAAHRASLDLPPDDRFTWRFALDRLLLGQALADPTHAELLGHAPGTGVEAKDDRAVLGGLVDFAETLVAEVEALGSDREPAAWFARIATATDRLLDDTSDRAWQKRQVLDTLSELAEHASDAGITDTVDLRTIRALLGDRFAAREPGQGFLGGAITVCELVPLRSIPFRVVCMLGIDDEKYPRVQPRPGYDRMALEPRPGDRDARADDRALFLEALLSARDHVVITCTGRSERTGRTLPLAVPVAELLETLSTMVTDEDARRRIRVEHPLQPWSPDLFVDGRSHDRRMAAAAEAWRTGREAPEAARKRFADVLEPCAPADVPKELTLTELWRFWRHPPTQLVRRRLGLRLFEDEVELSAALPFDLDALEQWSLSDAVLRAALSGESLDPDGAVARRHRRGATLPLGTPGEVALGASLEEIVGLIRHVAPDLSQPIPPLDVDLDLSIRLSGRVDRLFAVGRVVVIPGRVHPRHQLDAWIHHLALHASGWSGTSTVIGPRGGVWFGPVSPEEAMKTLETLCLWVEPGLNAPLLFWADVSHDAWEAHAADPGNEWSAHNGEKRMWDRRSDAEKLVDSWVLGYARPFSPKTDLASLLPSAEPEPLELARQVWEPALAVREDLQP